MTNRANRLDHDHDHDHDHDQTVGRRLHGERGTAIITVSVLLFAMTFGAIMVLTRDVNRVVTNRSAAQSIAFQAARAGAQEVRPGSLRGDIGSVVLDDEAAVVEAVRIADRLFASYGVVGLAEPSTRGDEVEVTVTIFDPKGDSEATATVQAQLGT